MAARVMALWSIGRSRRLKQKNGPGHAARSAVTRPPPSTIGYYINRASGKTAEVPRARGCFSFAGATVLPQTTARAAARSCARLPPPWRTSTSTRCRTSGGSTRPTRRSSRGSSCRSIRAPRSASSGSTARASPRCCASWPASTRTSSARRSRPTASASATCRRSRSSTRPRTCGATSRRRSRRPKALLRRFDEVNLKLGEA